ncbi:MAG: hypothetical protein SO442_02045 [Prevotella sp.]|nr:hypothetical protein [Prevotella sp.]MDD7335251.1 hypothetical protein [Prevotella sp.]MDY4625366.1 hypothetical protein [Prevotella sp.]
MKTRTIQFFLLLLCCFAFTACDSNKSKIEEKAKQFTEALKTKDVATIYDMYPNSKLANHMMLTTNVAPGDLEVVKDEATGNYTANFKNARDQKLIFKVTGKDTYQIIDSYGFFDIEPLYSDLAVKSGVPLKKLSDQKLKELFKDGGPFLSFIKNKYGGLTDINLYFYDGIWTSLNNWTSLQIQHNVRNDGDFPVKGSDYDVVFNFYDTDGVAPQSSKTLDGVDLAPGESFTYTFQINSYLSTAYNHTLAWTVYFNQKGGGTMKDIMKKAKFTGQEYSEFLQQQTKEKSKSKKAPKK